MTNESLPFGSPMLASWMDPKPKFDEVFLKTGAAPSLDYWEEHSKKIARRMKMAALFCPQFVVADSFLFSAASMYLFRNETEQGVLPLFNADAGKVPAPASIYFRDSSPDIKSMCKDVRSRVRNKTFEPFEGWEIGSEILLSEEFSGGYVAHLSGRLEAAHVERRSLKNMADLMLSGISNQENVSNSNLPDHFSEEFLADVRLRKEFMSRTLLYNLAKEKYYNRNDNVAYQQALTYSTHHYYRSMAGSGGFDLLEDNEISDAVHRDYRTSVFNSSLSAREAITEDIAMDLLHPDWYDKLSSVDIVRKFRSSAEFKAFASAFARASNSKELIEWHTGDLGNQFRRYTEFLSKEAPKYWNGASVYGPVGKTSKEYQSELANSPRPVAVLTLAAMGLGLAAFGQPGSTLTWGELGLGVAAAPLLGNAAPLLGKLAFTLLVGGTRDLFKDRGAGINPWIRSNLLTDPEEMLHKEQKAIAKLIRPLIRDGGQTGTLIR